MFCTIHSSSSSTRKVCELLLCSLVSSHILQSDYKMMTKQTEERRIKQLQKIEEMFTHQNISDYDEFGTKMNLIGEDLGLSNPFQWWKRYCTNLVEDKFERAKRTNTPPDWTEIDLRVIAVVRRFDNTYLVTQDGHEQKDTFSGAIEEGIAATSGKNQTTKKTAIVPSPNVTETSGDSQTSSTDKTQSETVQNKFSLQSTDGVGDRVAENPQPLKSTNSSSTSTKNHDSNGLSTRQATRKAAVIPSATVTQTSGDFQPSSTDETQSETVQKKSSRQNTDGVGDGVAENPQPLKSTNASRSAKNRANDKISTGKSIMRQTSSRGSRPKSKVRFNLTKMTAGDSNRNRKSHSATESSPPPPAKKNRPVSSKKSLPPIVLSQNNAPASNDQKEAQRAKSDPSTDTMQPVAPTSSQVFRQEKLKALFAVATANSNVAESNRLIAEEIRNLS